MQAFANVVYKLLRKEELSLAQRADVCVWLPRQDAHSGDPAATWWGTPFSPLEHRYAMIEIATDAVIGLAFAGFPAPVVPAWSRRKGLQRGPLGEVLVDLLANQLKSEGVTTVQRPQFSGNHIQRSMDLWERLRRHFAPES